MKKLGLIMALAVAGLFTQQASAIAHIYGGYEWTFDYNLGSLAGNGTVSGSATFDVWKDDSDVFTEGYVYPLFEKLQGETFFGIIPLNIEIDIPLPTHELTAVTFDPATWYATSLDKGTNPLLSVDFENLTSEWSFDLGAIHDKLDGHSVDVKATISNVWQKVEHAGGNAVPDSGSTLTLLGVGLVGMFLARKRARN